MKKLFILTYLLLLPFKSFCQPANRIELFDLIAMFVPSNDSQFIDWNSISKIKSPITWKTEGNEFTDDDDSNKLLGFYVRKGKILMPLNMNELAKSEDIVDWNISLYGSRVAIFNLFLSNDFMRYENCFDNECVQTYFRKRGAAIKLLRCDEENMLTGGKRFYELVIKKQSKIFLTVEFSCGSAGCSGNYIFHFNYPNEEYFIKQELTNTLCQ